MIIYWNVAQNTRWYTAIVAYPQSMSIFNIHNWNLKKFNGNAKTGKTVNKKMRRRGIPNWTKLHKHFKIPREVLKQVYWTDELRRDDLFDEILVGNTSLNALGLTFNFWWKIKDLYNTKCFTTYILILSVYIKNSIGRSCPKWRKKTRISDFAHCRYDAPHLHNFSYALILATGSFHTPDDDKYKTLDRLRSLLWSISFYWSTHSFFPPSTFHTVCMDTVQKNITVYLNPFLLLGGGVVNKLPLKFTCYLANKVVFPQPADEHVLIHYLETTSEKEVKLNCNHGAIQEICKFPCRRGHHHWCSPEMAWFVGLRRG